MNARLAAVANHPNRSKTNVRAAANPTPAQIRRAREAAGLTLEQAAELVHSGWGSWQQWETEASSAQHRRMHPATWELFQVKLAARKLLKERSISPAIVRELQLSLPAAE